LEKTKKTHYVPLQTREHAWAGMSGMLHYVGLEGHLRPEALNLEAWNHMLRDFLKQSLLKKKNETLGIYVGA